MVELCPDMIIADIWLHNEATDIAEHFSGTPARLVTSEQGDASVPQAYAARGLGRGIAKPTGEVLRISISSAFIRRTRCRPPAAAES
jgi:hypothetical protein